MNRPIHQKTLTNDLIGKYIEDLIKITRDSLSTFSLAYENLNAGESTIILCAHLDCISGVAAKLITDSALDVSKQTSEGNPKHDLEFKKAFTEKLQQRFTESFTFHITEFERK